MGKEEGGFFVLSAEKVKDGVLRSSGFEDRRRGRVLRSSDAEDRRITPIFEDQ